MAMHMKTLKQNANQINQNYYSMWLGLTVLEKVCSSLLNFLPFVGRFFLLAYLIGGSLTKNEMSAYFV